MRKAFVLLLTGVLGCLAGNEPATAKVLWDYSPATTGADLINAGANREGGQHFADIAVFPEAVRVTGMDVYTTMINGTLGTEAVVRVWADSSGAPGQLLLQSPPLTINAVDDLGTIPGDNVRAHADLESPLPLAAGTYWFSMAGIGQFDIGGLGQWMLSGPNAPGDGRLYQLFGDTLIQLVSNGDMAFRLEGTPEPSAFALAALSLLGLSLIRRRLSAW